MLLLSAGYQGSPVCGGMNNFAAGSSAPTIVSYCWHSSIFLRPLSTRMGRKSKNDIAALPSFTINEEWDKTKQAQFGNDTNRIYNFMNRVAKIWGLNGKEFFKDEVFETTRNNSHPQYAVMVKKKLLVPDHMRPFLHQPKAIIDVVSVGKSLSSARQQASIYMACELFGLLKCSQELMSAREVFLSKDRPVFALSAPSSISEQLAARALDLSNAIRGTVEISTVPLNPSAVVISEVSRVECSRPEPKVAFKSLPIFSHYDRIIQNIESNQVTVLSAATGSGKTTQIPQYILTHFWRKNPYIVVTQPRRIAAVSLASRVSEELGEAVGEHVGYAVRFDTVLPKRNEPSILFCTSGLLLRKIANGHDETWRNCTHLIIDEIHERDVDTDTLLLLVKQQLSRNSSMKVIIMSATLDADKFARYFSADGIQTAPPLNIEGSTNFPVAETHLEQIIGLVGNGGLCSESKNFISAEFGAAPVQEEGSECESSHVPVDVIAKLVAHLHTSKPDGAILCFIPGWEEIVAAKDLIEMRLKGSTKGYELHLIHSTSPPGSAEAMFKVSTRGARKIILATNVAESSITIPDVVYVVDSGRQKIKHYNPVSRMNSLDMFWISSANSIQRKGRVGRTQPGEYYAMWSKGRRLQPVTPPEMLRIGLEDVCLNIKAAGLTDRCERILREVIDPPDVPSVRLAVRSLIKLGALEVDGRNREQITNLGKTLAKIPLPPRFGRLFLLSKLFGFEKEASYVAGGLSERIFRAARTDEDRFRLRQAVMALAQGSKSDHCVIANVMDAFKSNSIEHVMGPEWFRIVSKASLQSALKIAHSCQDSARMHTIINLADSDAIFQLLLAGALYPDVAVKCPKRNLFMMSSGQTAEVSRDSVVLEESLENALASKTFSRSLNGWTELVGFEQVFESEYRKLRRISPIRPWMMVFIADSVRMLDNQRLIADDWVVIQGTSQILSDLMEARLAWLQTSKYLLNLYCADSMATLPPPVLDALKAFVDCLKTLSGLDSKLHWAVK